MASVVGSRNKDFWPVPSLENSRTDRIIARRLKFQSRPKTFNRSERDQQFKQTSRSLTFPALERVSKARILKRREMMATSDSDDKRSNREGSVTARGLRASGRIGRGVRCGRAIPNSHFVAMGGGSCQLFGKPGKPPAEAQREDEVWQRRRSKSTARNSRHPGRGGGSRTGRGLPSVEGPRDRYLGANPQSRNQRILTIRSIGSGRDRGSSRGRGSAVSRKSPSNRRSAGRGGGLFPPRRCFFEEGSVGYQLFPLIRSFLNVDDCVAFGKTGFAMQQRALARTYTVQELLLERGHASLPEARRIEIASKVLHDLQQYGRPKRIAQGCSHMFWASLYHPDELGEIHSIIDGCIGDNRTVSRPTGRYLHDDGSFRGFFSRPGLDDTVFICLRSYLTVCDLHVLCKANVVSGNKLFKMVSLDEVLVQRGYEISRRDRTALGIDVRKLVVSYRDNIVRSSMAKRPHRAVEGFADRWRMQYLFHPEEHSCLLSAVEHCLRYRNERLDYNPNGNPTQTLFPERRLLSARFGNMDVTYRVASLARQNGGRFNPQPPGRPRNGLGRAFRQPITFQYWYTRIFGDPGSTPSPPRNLKIVTLSLSDPSDVATTTLAEPCLIKQRGTFTGYSSDPPTTTISFRLVV